MASFLQRYLALVMRLATLQALTRRSRVRDEARRSCACANATRGCPAAAARQLNAVLAGRRLRLHQRMAPSLRPRTHWQGFLHNAGLDHGPLAVRINTHAAGLASRRSSRASVSRSASAAEPASRASFAHRCTWATAKPHPASQTAASRTRRPRWPELSRQPRRAAIYRHPSSVSSVRAGAVAVSVHSAGIGGPGVVGAQAQRMGCLAAGQRSTFWASSRLTR